MTDVVRPSPEEIVLYEKNPATRIATITSVSSDDLTLGDESFGNGLNNTVNDNDLQFPADWRLNYGGRKRA